MNDKTEENTNTESDSAWVTVATPFDVDELKLFCSDIEKIFRINPLYEYEEWQDLGDGSFRVRCRNLSNGKYLNFDISVEERGESLFVIYSDGLKRSTSFRIEKTPEGTNLVVTDDYSGHSEADRKARIEEVDQTLVPWGNALWRYFKLWKRWSWLAPWRFYMSRMWLPMKPSARRIASMIIMITIAEFVGFLMFFSVFWLELDKYF